MKRTTIIIIWKIIRCVTLIFGVSVLTFVLLKQSPVDPVMASVNYDTSLTPAQYKAIAHHYGLDKPALVQYFIWLKNVIQGHLGSRSFIGNLLVILLDHGQVLLSYLWDSLGSYRVLLDLS